MTTSTRTLIAATTLLCAAACKVGPEYERPKMATPADWMEPLEGGLVEHEVDLATWWSVLGDAELDSLVQRAVEKNLDIAVAVARVDEARARYGIAQADRLPTIDASGGATWTNPSKNDPLTGSDLGGSTYDQYDVGIDASWEVDVWGRVRREVQAAKAGFQASVEDMHAVRVSLVAEVARSYIELRSAQERLAISVSNVATQKNSYDLAKARMDLGLAPELEVAQAETNLATTEAGIPAFTEQIARAQHRIAVLLGEPPGALTNELATPKALPELPAQVAMDLPADLVRRRPDIRAAERRLASETALIGVAEADLYPLFTLSGSFGFTSGDLGSLIDGNSLRFEAGPFFRWHLFDLGRVRNRIREQDARARAAVAIYEQVVLTSLQDVEDAIAGYVQTQKRRDKLVLAEAAARRTVDLANELYKSGLRDFQEVLTAERALLLLQDERANTGALVVLNLVRLYASLGGGWNAEAPNREKNSAPEKSAAPASP